MKEPRSLTGQKGLYILKPCTRKLIGFLSHAEPRLREEGAKALGKIGDPEAIVPLTEAILNEKQDTCMPEALAAIGDELAFNNLLKAYSEADKEVRPNIATALGCFKNKLAIDALIAGLSDLDANVRYACVTALGKLRDLSTVSPLLGCLGESNEWIFLNVVDALAKLHSHKATNPLVAFYLRERNERKRAAIIAAFGELGDLTSVTTLTRAMRDSDDRVKANAIESISKMGLPRDKVFALIQPFFKYPSNRVRGNALVAAYNLGKTQELSVIIRNMINDADKWVRATLGYVLSVIDCDDAMEFIIELLHDDEPLVRKNAARALYAKANEAQSQLIFSLISDNIPFVRLQAIALVGKLKATAAVPLLIEQLEKERNHRIRASIVSSLGHIGGYDASETLKNALHDMDSRVRANAVEGLEETLGIDAINVIKPMLRDSDNRTKANAARALFRMGELWVLKDLEAMLASRDISLKLSAAYSMAQIGQALNELEEIPLRSNLTMELEKVELPTMHQVVRSVIDEVATAPVIAEKKVNNDDKVIELPINTALPAAGKSGAEIREEMRARYQDFYNVGKLKEAEEAIEEFLKKYPYDIKALCFAGNLYFKFSRFTDVIKLYSKVLEMDPFNIQALSNLGTAYYRSTQSEDAIDCYRKALKLKPDLSVIRFNLASIYLKLNKWDDAIKQYEEGLRYQQPNPRVLNNLALAYQKITELDKAAEIYRKVLVLDSHDAGAYYNLALIMTKQGKTNEAVMLLRRSLNAVEKGTPGYRNLVELLDRLKS